MSKRFIRYAVVEDKMQPGEFRVEAIDVNRDGDAYITAFIGPDSRARAEEYALWKNGSQK